MAAAFALRLHRLDAQDVWWDEARNIDVASRPWSEIATAGELDIHPPLYFYFLHGWMGAAGGSAFAIRFLSAWFGVLLVALLHRLGCLVGGGWAGLGAASGAAFLPFLLGEAQEARMYTMMLVWLVAAGVMLAAGMRGGQERGAGRARLVRWALFGLFAGLALLTHYAAIFALVALFAWAGVWALAGRSFDVAAGGPVALRARAGYRGAAQPAGAVRLHRLGDVALGGAALALTVLPAAPIAIRQIPSYRNPNLAVPSVREFLAELARVYSVGEHAAAAAVWPAAGITAGLLVIGWALAVCRRRSRPGDVAMQPARMRAVGTAAGRGPHAGAREPLLLLALFWALIPPLVYYLVIRDRSTFATRYISAAAPGWLLLGGLALAGWARARPALGAVATVAMVGALVPGIAGDLAAPRDYREDTRGVIAWLNETTDPASDLILVDQRYPFGFYHPRWNGAADGEPPAEPADCTPAQYLFVDMDAVADRLTALTSGRQRVFWVQWFESDTDPRGAVKFLLERHGRLAGERSFRGYVVTWYDLPSEPMFELAAHLGGPPADFAGQLRMEAFEIGAGGQAVGPSQPTPGEGGEVVAPADRPLWAVVRWSLPAGDGGLARATAERVDRSREGTPEAALPRGLKATLVLADANGQVVGRDDRPVVNDRHLAPAEWTAAEHPVGVFLLHPDVATPPGLYELRLAVYNPASLSQLSTGAGAFVILGRVRLTRALQAVLADDLPLDARPELVWRGLRLLGRGPLPAQVGPGELLAVDLYWQAERGRASDLRARLTLHPVGQPLGSGSGPAQEADPATDAIDGVGAEAPLVHGRPTGEWDEGEIARGRQARRLDPSLPAGVHAVVLRLVDAADREASPPVELGRVEIAGRAHTYERPAMGAALEATFGALGRLLGFDGPTIAGSALSLTLYWQAEAPTETPYSVSVQLLDAEGRLRAQRDQQPGDGALPTTGWVAGEVLVDPYRIDLPAGLPSGRYAVVVKVYEPVTGEVLPVSGPDGAFARLADVALP